MRILFVLLLAPASLWAQDEAAVMTATCQCEIWNGEGILVQPQIHHDAFLGMAPGLNQNFFARGTYKLDREGRTTTFMDSTSDKNCSGDKNGVMTASCFNAAWYATRRAERACSQKAALEFASGDKPGSGQLIGQCRYELDGETLAVPESLQNFL